MDLTTMDNIKKKAFLVAFAECGNVTQAAQAAGIVRQTHYEWLDSIPEYAELFELAKESAADKLEQEARRRAVQGVEEVVYYQGKEVGRQLRYSDNLLMFMLKGERPEKFKDRTELTGAKGGPIQLEAMTADQRQSRINELLGKRDG
jgi:hypothetical protein